MECMFKHVSFDGIAAVVPERFINIDDEIAFFDNNPKKLLRAKKIIGYGKRHVVLTGTTTLDLCEVAARRLLHGMAIAADSIDTLIVVNQSPDHFLPSGSCILHGRLGLAKSCAALDISLGCSGYVYGLWLAHSLIASGASRQLLLLAGDTPSLHSDVANRLTNPLFGDAGTATLLRRTADENPAYFTLGSDGTGWHHIVIPGGGFRLPPDRGMLETVHHDAQGNPWKMTESILEGMPVFNFTLHEVPPSIQAVLDAAGLSVDDVDFFALHQANKQIVQAIATALDLPADKVSWETFSRYGNQSTASVACTLCDALAESMPRGRQKLLLSGFGVGLSWANAVLTCDHAYNGGVTFFSPSGDAPTRDALLSFWNQKFVSEE